MKNNRFGPGEREIYLIHYVISGKGYFNGNIVSAGQGFLIRPHTYEYYYPDLKDPWRFLWVTSYDSAIEELFQKLKADENTQIFNYNYRSEVEELTEVIKQNHNRNYSAAKILEIFLNLFNSNEKYEAETKKDKDIYFEYAVNYIKTNISRSVKVSEITEVLGINQPYLYGVFKKKCSLSPKEYVDNCRFKIAKNMLKNTQMMIGDIGRSVGFEDQFVFSRFFKKKAGVSPAEFRKIK